MLMVGACAIAKLCPVLMPGLQRTGRESETGLTRLAALLYTETTVVSNGRSRQSANTMHGCEQVPTPMTQDQTYTDLSQLLADWNQDSATFGQQQKS